MEEKNSRYYGTLDEFLKNQTLCWKCAKANGQCKWSHDGTRIDGWEATDAVLCDGTETVNITSCPSYVFLDSSCDDCKYFNSTKKIQGCFKNRCEICCYNPLHKGEGTDMKDVEENYDGGNYD